MFAYYSNLNDITALANWNTKNVTDMRFMFQNCTNLTTLDISGWNTSKVNDISYFLETCSKLTG